MNLIFEIVKKNSGYMALVFILYFLLIVYLAYEKYFKKR